MREQLIKDMKKEAKGASFITPKQLAKVLGYEDTHSAYKYLDGVQKLKSGRYFIYEVANNIEKDMNNET